MMKETESKAEDATETDESDDAPEEVILAGVKSSAIKNKATKDLAKVAKMKLHSSPVEVHIHVGSM